MTCEAAADPAAAAMDDIIKFVAGHKEKPIALICHPRPDGDALGSVLGLASLLRAAGYDATAVNAQPVPQKLAFLAPPSAVRVYDSPDWHREYGCVGVLDCGDLDRLEPVNREAARVLPAFTVDHHASSKGLGQAVWIEPGASSTGEMLVRLARRAGWPIPPDAADALWTAIVTDTGRFSFSNTSVSALAAAAECIKAGANPARAAENIYQTVSVPERKLQALVLSRLEFHAGGRLGLSWLAGADFRQAGIGVDGSQDLVNLVRDTVGVEVAIFFYELPHPRADFPHSIKVSIRTSESHSALDVATAFHGGGHLRAAGCSVAGTMEEARAKVLEMALRCYFG